MHLVVWIVLCLGAATFLRRRPAVLVLLALALWTIVPGVVSGQLTGRAGGSLGVHAATWLLLAVFLLQWVTDPRALAEALAHRFLSYLVILLVIFAAVLETKTGSAGHGVVLILDEMAAPFLGYWILSAAVRARPSEALVLRNGFIALAAAEAAFTVLQYLSDNVLLYGSYYGQRYWFQPGWNRWMGTTDHPLVLSMLLGAAIPLLVGLRRTWLQPVLMVLMLVAVVITQSRSGVLAAAVGAIYVVLASRTSTLRKVATITGMAVSAVLIATSSLSAGVVDRVQNDQGSALARGSAWTYFLDNWPKFTFTGGGISSNYTVAADSALDTSFESAFLMYAIDLGILLALAYFVTQLVIVFRGSAHRVPGARLSALVVLVLCQTFNSLEVATLVGMLIWFIVALSALPATAPESVSEQRSLTAQPANARASRASAATSSAV